jgi:thioredoxin-dependent peroxiredoxin
MSKLSKAAENIFPVTGDMAPDFTAITQTGEEIHLYDVLQAGSKVLLIFYPGDDTPGCTAQLCGVRDVYTEYQKKGIKVFGINHADQKSHQKFINKHQYQFDILVDTNKEIAHKYGAIKKFFSNQIIKRGVFLIDTDCEILYNVWGQQDNQLVINSITRD